MRTDLARLLAFSLCLAFALGCDPDPPGDGRDASVDDPDVGSDSGMARPPVAFSVTTWNVHDFFDEHNNPDVRDEVYSTSQVNTKIGKLSKVLNRIRPDVLALQEVENEPLMVRLNDKLDLKLPFRALVPASDPRGINVALMSRFPITEKVTHKDERFYDPEGYSRYSFSRDCLEVHLDLGGGRRAVVLVNHQISQIEDGADTVRKRKAQAQRTREIADGLRAQDGSRPVIISGDMNDDVGSESMQIYFAGGEWVDIGAQTPVADRFTYVYQYQRLRFDYLLPNRETAGWLRSISILHGTDVDLAASAASDHAPVTAAFDFP